MLNRINTQEVIERRENAAAMAELQKIKKSIGKVAKYHNKWYWSEEEKKLMKEGTVAELKKFCNTLYNDKVKFASYDQMKHCKKMNKDFSLNLDFEELKRLTIEEMSTFIREELSLLVKEASKKLPLTEKQLYTLDGMKLCISIKFTDDYSSLTREEASEIISKNMPTYQKFLNALPTPSQIERANYYQVKMGNAPLYPETIAAFADPENPEKSRELFERFIAQLRKEYYTYKKQTSLEPERKERTREDELSEDEKEYNETMSIVSKLYSSLGQSVPSDLTITSLEQIREIGEFVTEFTNGRPPITIFKGCKYFNKYDVAYIFGVTLDVVEKYLDL